MELKTYTVLTLMVTSSAAFAWQPLTYPIRSQSPYQRSIDTAMCYAEANRLTKVDIKRESQIPPREPPATPTSSTGMPSKPPLPPSSFSATPLPWSASEPAETGALSEPTTTAAAPTGASSAKSVNEATAGTTAASNAAGASAGPAASTSASPSPSATAAAPASAGAGASDGAAASLQANAASGVKLPPLPAPEPPMTRYWAAYGACMQARGYVVQ
ncbi:hypothetical protein [Paraburkholderia susongensis]|uniref:Uncharacterized protein n=1 Tax=Paraburkholderia susongensis TaxID=1515439 RepID=A0A1X7KSD9_9BURK|nr:hypothetical protein [Paraburkholderia susongensis]SMG44376.1 hypothetical protein SAMN06265784_104262 [Paraburkholderia susongensis]